MNTDKKKCIIKRMKEITSSGLAFSQISIWREVEERGYPGYKMEVMEIKKIKSLKFALFYASFTIMFRNTFIIIM